MCAVLSYSHTYYAKMNVSCPASFTLAGSGDIFACHIRLHEKLPAGLLTEMPVRPGN